MSGLLDPTGFTGQEDLYVALLSSENVLGDRGLGVTCEGNGHRLRDRFLEGALTDEEPPPPAREQGNPESRSWEEAVSLGNMEDPRVMGYPDMVTVSLRI